MHSCRIIDLPVWLQAQGKSPHWRMMHDGGRLRRVDGEALQGARFAGGHQVRGRDGRSHIVKKTSTAAATAVMAALTGSALAACSVSTPAPAESSQSSAVPSPSDPGTQRSSSAASTGPGSHSAAARSGGTREACELFNELVADYAAVPPTDSKGYEDVYSKAQDAKDTVSGDLRGLFTSLGLLAINRSSAADSGGKASQESQDAVRDAVFANAGTCTAAGVTLRL
ncbi:hypothetical protein [Arthrobacter sp. ISL-85]|uniref:hypothetical protein n=1 Tax=Arthrobacter sp. ISL-85 TaxID=2819115 RepID=UPI002035DAF1|nr:hypothetical protein [Arthrobacter sp. ISL-85]